MFWNKKNKNKSHIKREWSAEIGKLNYIIENMEKGINKDWVLDELDDLYEIVERLQIWTNILMKKVFLILLFISSCSNDNSENKPIGQANPELGIENIIKFMVRFKIKKCRKSNFEYN